MPLYVHIFFKKVIRTSLNDPVSLSHSFMRTSFCTFRMSRWHMDLNNDGSCPKGRKEAFERPLPFPGLEVFVGAIFSVSMIMIIGPLCFAVCQISWSNTCPQRRKKSKFYFCLPSKNLFTKLSKPQLAHWLSVIFDSIERLWVQV